MYFNGFARELKIPINEDLLKNAINIDDSSLAGTERYKIQNTKKLLKNLSVKASKGNIDTFSC